MRYAYTQMHRFEDEFPDIFRLCIDDEVAGGRSIFKMYHWRKPAGILNPLRKTNCLLLNYKTYVWRQHGTLLSVFSIQNNGWLIKGFFFFQMLY
ncbi:hypothetical protein HanXRQr2_Chr11g0507461 [Helianthus annuus]|uniref:Uncharacterized protein n=1 Tax=Helianthus annuus TaxID=4232 RepID=A0A9K3N1U7_HELAN|nr:hypothetical protein HanXRQr2_Chr11g0507461 [Helianthus annuus]KAJ0510908.1 hypothetical protein HanIR_Chr11g0545961 [Helianthus annuus]KAJ0518684.1 hypothetical protein HanHA89_Chr11g0440211 [Helianthus annuus]KAJ0690528.1 hypothetical protein HanOQP8_Chr11g0418841 [Helianthus annuus]